MSIFMVFILTACDQFGIDDAVELSEEYCRDNPTSDICQADPLEAVDKTVVETTLKSFLTSFNDYDNQEQYCEDYISVTNLELLDACKEDINTILPPNLNDFEIEEITTDLLNMKSVVEVSTEESTYFFDVQFTEEDGDILIAKWSYRTLDTEMNSDETPPTFDYINDVYLSTDVTSYDWQSLVKNATDDVSSDLTIYIEENTVDFGTVGEYKVTISVTDETGNKATQTVPVIISEDTDNLPPVVEEGQTTVKLGSTTEEFPYLDYFEIIDPDGDDLTYKVIKDEIEYGTIGTYDFIFSATDTAGNELIIDVEVEVFDNDVPTFDTIEDQLLSSDVTSYDWTTFLTNLTDRNSDNITVEVIESNVIFGEVGTYQVTLLVADEFGNEVEESFTVEIYDPSTDVEAPTFDAISDQEIDINVSNVTWEDYIMNLSDNNDTLDDLEITVNDNVNYGTVGTYTVTIKVSDSNDNTTTQSFDVSVVNQVEIDTLFTSYLDEYIDPTIDSEVLCEKYYDPFDLTTCITQRDQLLEQSISYSPEIIYEEASNGYYVEFNLIVNDEPLDPITLNIIPTKVEETWLLTIQTSIDLRPLNLDEAYAAYQEFLDDYLDKDLTVSELLYLYFEEDSDTDLSEEFQYREEFLSLETTFRDLIITPVNPDNMSPFIIEVTRNTGGEDIPLTFIGDLYKTRDGRYVFDITYQTTATLADYQDFMVYFVNQFNNLDTSQTEVCDRFFETSQWCMNLTKPTSDNDAFLSLTEFFEHAQGYTAIFTQRTSQGYEKYMYDVEFTILDETMEMNFVEPAYNWVYESMEDVWAYLDQFSQAFNDTTITHSDFCQTYVTDTIYEDCEQYRTEKHANNEQLMDQSIEIALTGYVASLIYSDDAGNTYTEEIDIWFEVEENNLLATFYVLEQQTTPDDITHDEAQQTIIDKVNAFNNSTISDEEFCENNSDLFFNCYTLREAMTDSGWIELNTFEFIEDEENGSYYKTTFNVYFSETESAHTIIGKYTFNYDNNQEIVITTMHVTSAFSYSSFADAQPIFTDFINDYLIYDLSSEVLVNRYNLLVDPVWLFVRGTIVESELELVDIVFEDNASYPDEHLYATVTFTDNINTYTMNYKFKVRTDFNNEITIEFTELDPPIIPQYFASVFIESVLMRAYYDDEDVYCADYVEDKYTTECQEFKNHLLEYSGAEMGSITYDEVDLTYTAEVNLYGSMGTTSATETYIFTIYYDEESNPRILLDRWQQ
ncbi:MAG: hypothetical protein K9L74_07510 [Candidatus Izimaplasma sp.]|nr:hypothetical protein [Candidatus Izimaplasma bacterium]